MEELKVKGFFEKMSTKYCPVCNRKLGFGITFPIPFEGEKICITCFKKSQEGKFSEIAELKKVVEIFPLTNEQIESQKGNFSQSSSGQITVKTETKGFGFLKACLGFTALGPAGLLCGLCGSGKTKTTVIKN